MIYDPNNKNVGTKSNKIRRESKILRYMADKLDSDQDIKRYLHYNTLSPLSSKSRYSVDSTEIIMQPDISKSLIGENIIKAPFKDEIITENQNLVFVWSPSAKYGSTIGNMYINVVIIVSEKYNAQEYDDEDRNVNIAIKIADVFDNYTIDYKDAIYTDVGSVKFELIDRGTERLAKSNDYVVYGMTFKIDFVSMRG